MSMHYIVVADEARARLFTADERLDALTEIEDLVHPQGRMAARELRSDRPGRFTRGDGRMAAEPRTDAETIEATRFARQVCDALRDRRGDFERLVLIAPPRFLGALRAELEPSLAARVVLSVPKDLTRLPAPELAVAVRGALPDDAGLPSHVP